MMKLYALNAPLKTLTAAVLLSLLSACGGDNDNNDGGDLTPPGNTAPVANPVDASATMGSPSMIDALANDTDADGDPLTLETVTLFDGRGVATIDGNRIRFEPLEVGTTILNYSISDGNGGHASSTVTISVAAQALSYVGSEACLSCHIDKKSYLETGHNFKLTKVNGEEPLYPFTSISGSVEQLDVNNSLGNPNGWEDISYVIGGYMRSAMFIDQNGYIMTGDKAGAGVAPKGEQVPYMWPWHADDAPDSAPFDYCGRCHTTGWRDYTEGSRDDRNLNRQDDMPGMGGTFALTGIQCEACHGAGLAHIQKPSKDNIVKVAEARSTNDFLAEDMGFGKPIACAECHSTDDAVRRYPDYVSPHNQEFGGDSLEARLKVMTGFGPEGRRDGRGGRQAATELLGTDPDTGEAMGKKKGFTCSTCHNPHQSKVNMDKPGHENAMVRQCTDCHTQEFNNAPGSDIASAAHEFTATCLDCHMPGGSDSHMFKIDLEGAKDDPRHFSANGDYVKPWLRAYDSCSGCHQEDYDERAARIGTIHN